MPSAPHRFRFVVLGRYPARLKGNQTAVTVNVAAGEPGHLVYCGTLTMAEAEFESLRAALQEGLGGAVEVEDPTHGGPPAAAGG